MGIGRATAVALRARGMRVLATGLEAGLLDELAHAHGAEVMPADLSRADEVERLVEWAGQVDLLVNNAGVGRDEAIGEIDLQTSLQMLMVNLAAPMRLTAALAPGMVARGRGHIVNVASIAGWVGVAHESVYAASKGGLIAFSESARYELAGTGVGVTVVVPAAVRTAFFERKGGTYRRTVPRMVPPERVAVAIVEAVRRGTAEVFVPRWMIVPARLRGAAPRLYRRLAAGPATR
jgi:short-subunit dehydrogenase